jgi:hypothetical protein
MPSANNFNCVCDSTGKQSPTSANWWESLTLESQTSFTWLLSHDGRYWWSLPQRLLPLCLSTEVDLRLYANFVAHHVGALAGF